jgi:K(+)-stimulated pyrophosphate-energized sodium pump
VAGANRDGWHLLGVEAGRDYTPRFADIREAREGDTCPSCGGALRFQTAIEVGHIFKFGSRYSEPLDARFLDEDGVEKPLIGGSYGVAWFGIRVNTFANSRTAFAALKGKPFPCYSIPLKAGMSIGMLLISVELFLMLCILLFVPRDYAGPCFIGFAIGESLGAAVLRIAGGIFTKIADIGSDLMKIVFNIKEDDARNPGVIADCTGDNAGDSVGPSADGFETYGVTGVALISFILLAVKDPQVQVQLLVWIFVMRIAMIIASGLSYFINEAVAKGRYGNVDKMNFEAPLTSLVWLTSFISVAITYLVSSFLVPDLGDGTLWWKLSTVITCGTLAGAIIPELVKVMAESESYRKSPATNWREM